LKKFIFILLLLQFVFYTYAYKIMSIKGGNNVKKVISSKPVYVVFTANKVLIWDESYEKLVKDERKKRKNMPTFASMKEKMYKNFTGSVKFKGRKWGMEVIKSISQAKKGYVLHINVYKVIPAPMAGLTARYMIRAYKAGSKKVLFSADMKITQISGVCTIPRCALASAGDMLAEEFYGFMRRGK
jgi:hypothetical protein